MRTERKILTEWWMRWATSTANERADEMKRAVDQLRDDARRTDRLRVGECASCFYLDRGRVGGNAMTTWFCGLCGAEQMATNTNHGRVCLECSNDHKLCTRCGGDLERRERRRKWPEPKPPGDF